jgi:hypothetical protein
MFRKTGVFECNKKAINTVIVLMIKSLLKNEEKQSFTNNIHYVILELIVIYEVKILLWSNSMLPEHLTVLSTVFYFAWISYIFDFRFAAFLNTYLSLISNKVSLIARIMDISLRGNEYFVTKSLKIYFLWMIG